MAATRRGVKLPGLVEAFYDPLGSFNDGAFGGPIGGHSDHVHVSDTIPQGMLRAIAMAQGMGLHVGENPYVDTVDPVHVKGSYHYRRFPGQYNGRALGEGLDVSGDPDQMAAYYRKVTSGAQQPTQTPSAWPESAQLAYSDAVTAGLTGDQAKDFAAVQYGESGFNPKAVNKTSGAAGLYQLLSPGYRQRAENLGGVLNPEANIQAILPDYVRYYRQHPNAQPGAAGAAVERSGEGADYYAAGLAHLTGQPAGGRPQPAPLPVSRQLAASQQRPNKKLLQIALQLLR